MSIETHKTIVNRFFQEGLSDGKLEILENILSPECSYFDGGIQEHSTRKDFIEYVREARKPFTYTEVVVEDVIAEGDKAAVRCTYHLETESDRFTIPVMGFFQFDDCKIVKIWRNMAASGDGE